MPTQKPAPHTKPIAKRRAYVRPAISPRRADPSVHVVGLGASAGGLEALEAFFAKVPADSGLAFVVVQHLDPTRKGMLVELLQRATALPVVQIRDRMKIAPDRIHVIPPNNDLSILHGVLHLLDPVDPRGQRSPIDFFFRSLAADAGPAAIGVILSGMGSDGTSGVGAIKEQGGAVFVQAPDSAKYDAMPRSAIEAGFADVVAPVEELVERILAFRNQAANFTSPDQTLTTGAMGAIEKICVLLRAQTGHDFSDYKRSTIHRRVERRMGLHQLDGLDDYVRYLRESPQEIGLLFKELLIGVTSFFRDPQAWERLVSEAIPQLLDQRPDGGVLRAWVPGCATGEEAYSLAMALQEGMAAARPARRFSLQIFATDLDPDAIERARHGIYPPNIESDVNPERLGRYFVKDERGYRVAPQIREAVVFATQNVIMDPPFTKLDLLSCRNLLIYLSAELQKKLLPLFHYSLRPGGILFLGSAESVGPATDLFAPLAGKARIFQRLESVPQPDRVEFPTAFHAPKAAVDAVQRRQAAPGDLQALTEGLLLQHHAPSAVLTNAQGDILYVSGHTGTYLEPAAGKANWNIHAMARPGLSAELVSGFQRARRTRRAVVCRAEIGSGRALKTVQASVELLDDPEPLRGLLLIVFTELDQAPAARPRGKTKRSTQAVARLEQEVTRLGLELRTTREDMQSSQEELKSANEELQSANEELQSTNEELTTSKEEMQSLNEELQTLNHELQAKVDELSRANDDLRNLLDSTDIATLFLDGSLRVRRYTAKMTGIFKLLPGDVDRPITDLATDLIYPDLADHAQQVLRSLVFTERQVQTRTGRWYTVRIMPYRTVDDRIDGLVITFLDITNSKNLEQQLREQRAD